MHYGARVATVSWQCLCLSLFATFSNRSQRCLHEQNITFPTGLLHWHRDPFLHTLRLSRIFDRNPFGICSRLYFWFTVEKVLEENKRLTLLVQQREARILELQRSSPGNAWTITSRCLAEIIPWAPRPFWYHPVVATVYPQYDTLLIFDLKNRVCHVCRKKMKNV